MNSKFIQDHLYRKFAQEKYQLDTSFIYEWEADFYYRNSSLYSNEIEIKISYQDFRADFKKISKHNHLKAQYENKETFVDFKYHTYQLKSEATQCRRGKEIPEKTWTSRETNKSQVPKWKKRDIQYELISTEIQIKPVGNVPNKFWYICPDGVIPIEEVPEYAGLYYISNRGRITIQKRAPFITKEIFDLDRVLLDKFYYLCRNLKNSL